MTWQELRAHIDAKIEGVEDRRERWEIVSTIRWVMRTTDTGLYVSLGEQARAMLVREPEKALIFDGRDNEELKYNFYRSLLNSGDLEIVLWGAH